MLPALLRLARGQVLVLTGHRTRAPGIERTGPHPAGLAVRTRDSGNSGAGAKTDRKSTRLNSSHLGISYAVFCLKKIIIDGKPFSFVVETLRCAAAHGALILS